MTNSNSEKHQLVTEQELEERLIELQNDMGGGLVISQENMANEVERKTTQLFTQKISLLEIQIRLIKRKIKVIEITLGLSKDSG